MKTKLLIILCLLVFSCKTDPKNYIAFLDGYWEIESVTLSDGKKKAYNMNLTIDYIAVSDSLTGIRKKLKPNFSGTYETSNSFEIFHVRVENDSLHLDYKTPFATWRETVLFASEEKLQVITENNDVFLYRKYIPLNFD
jgi:hypothetical protein